MNPTVKEMMEKMKQQADQDREEREARLRAHPYVRTEAGDPVVQFSVPDVSVATLDTHDYGIAMFLPHAGGGSPLQIGSVYLSARDRGQTLHLDKVVVHGHAGGQGFGAAALRHLVELARSAGYTSIKGEVSPENGERLDDLRRWYRKHGFTVDADDNIAYDLSVPIPL